MKNTIVSMVLGAIALFSFEANAEWRVESIDNDFPYEIEEAAAEGKSLIIFFHQAGCPHCDKMRARVLPDPKVDAYYGDRFVMIESNIRGNFDVISPDGEEMNEVEFGRKSRVRLTPVFIFYDQEGKQALRTTGYLNPERFILAGQYVTDGVYKTGTSFFRYVKEQEGK